MKLFATGGAALALAAFVATAAFAHAHLTRAEPAAGARVEQAPTKLTLTFSEGIEPRFSAVTLVSDKGAAIALGALSVRPPAATVVTVPVPTPLGRGTYTVKWRATSVDSHKTQGSYRFTVGR